MRKIIKPVARKSLKVIAFSKAEDQYVSFLCGTLDDKAIFVASRKGLAAVRSEANQLTWDTKRGDLKITGLGACKLENDQLSIRTEGVKVAKGSVSVIRDAAKDYFKTHHKLGLLWSRVVKEDSPIIEDDFLSDDADETMGLIGDDDLDRSLADAALEFGDGITDSDGEETLDEDESGTGSDSESDTSATGVDEKTDADTLADDDDIAEEDSNAESSLQPELATLIKSQLDGIVDTLFKVAAGVKIDSAPADIIQKFFGWLERILLALPPHERATAAANWLSRLQLAISSSTQAMRDSTVVGAKKDSASKDEKSTGADGQETDDTDISKIIPGTDLNDLTSDPLNEDEVVKAIFDKALAEVGDPGPQYELSLATDGNVRKMVKSRLASFQADDSAQPKDTGAAIRMMFTVLQDGFFQDTTKEKLLGLLGLKALSPQQKSIAGWIAKWKQAHASARDQVQQVKDAAEASLKVEDDSFTVERLGGSWTNIDNIFTQVDTVEIEAELREVVNSAGNDKFKNAIEAADATLQANVAWLSSNNIVDLVDNAPFPGAEVSVGPTLLGSLKEISSNLKTLTEKAD